MRKTLTLTAALLVMGCGSDDNSFPIGPFPNPTPIVTAPSAVADSFTTLGNSVLTGSVTANDTLNGATVTTFQNPSNSGGTVTISAAGQLTYTPPLNVANVNDTFTYTLSNSAGSSTATVSVQIQARGFFVKNDVAASGSGSQSSPFKTLLEATTAATGVAGAQVVVFRGDGTATGQNVPVSLSAATQAIVAQDPANPPTIAGPITLANNCTLANLRLVGTTAGDAVIGTGINGASLSNLTIANTTNGAVNMTNPTGNVTLTGLTLSNLGNQALPLSTTAGTLNYTVSNLSVNNTTANVSLAEITGTSVVNASFTDITCTNIGTVFPFNIGFDWNARNAANCTLAVNNFRMDTGGAGIFFFSRDTSRTAVLISNANVTNCSDRGALLSALNGSSLKTRSTNSRYLGNFPGSFRCEAGFTATLCARLTGNTSDSYEFLQGGTGILQVENLAGVSTENVGASSPSGTVQDVAIGSCGIP